jgi:hypothetical protein
MNRQVHSSDLYITSYSFLQMSDTLFITTYIFIDDSFQFAEEFKFSMN